MSDTYEAFYNGKPLNPNRGLPTMSYAQAEDCGLTDSERLWCRTDGDGTVITADEVPYDSNNSVKDKIDSIPDIETYTDTAYGNNVYTMLMGHIVYMRIETRTNISLNGWENKQIGQLPANMASPYSYSYSLPLQGATNEQRNAVLNVNGRVISISNQSGSSVTVGALLRGMYSFVR